MSKIDELKKQLEAADRKRGETDRKWNEAGRKWGEACHECNEADREWIRLGQQLREAEAATAGKGAE